MVKTHQLIMETISPAQQFWSANGTTFLKAGVLHFSDLNHADVCKATNSNFVFTLVKLKIKWDLKKKK